MIRLVQPQAVMVELCAGRAARLRSPGGGGGDGDFLKVGGRVGGWVDAQSIGCSADWAGLGGALPACPACWYRFTAAAAATVGSLPASHCATHIQPRPCPHLHLHPLPRPCSNC